MKVSVSLPGEDVRFLDEYAKEEGLESRSAALHRAVRLLRTSELGAAYESAWEQWPADGDAELWDSTVGDGLPDRAPS
ncbi:MAG: ribbon-helix-helix domain-containing protein [Chloroflexota bacterium]|nr:ribbon-helix-helix domain-containing protein [Chloroflexota bacterium]